jgi:error-prone DNA polymerase
MARALGFSQGQQDAWSKQMSRWGPLAESPDLEGIPDQVVDLAVQIKDLPRHMGIHSGGMVICDRPIADVCPVEWARMPGRSVLQWDKDDCAAIGLVKFDLLGLGMLSALHYAIDLVAEHKGVEVDLATLDLSDSRVYEMLQRADSVGVFQVESRAQMATLPRLKPRVFYDLVVEVALIRPGPIQGGSVHPYIKRRNGLETIVYDHPSMEPALRKTLGVPLFQEQLMQVAVDCAGFSAAEADELRRAMGSKRSTAKMRRLRDRFYAGMQQRHGITGEVADRIYEKLEAFANFGFPPRWCSIRRGSSCITRRRSARRCCGHSRWGSTRRSRWSPTRADTGFGCMGRASTPAWRTPRVRTPDWRCGSGWEPSGTSAASWLSASLTSGMPTAPSPLCWI